MTGYSHLIDVAFYVALFTIIGLAITFSLLFFLYARYKKKHILYGHEDEKLLKELKRKYKHILSKDDHDLIDTYNDDDKYQLEYANIVKNVETFLYNHPEVEKKDKIRLAKLLNLDEEKEKRRKKRSRIYTIIFSSIFVLIIILIASFKLNGESFYLGDETYIVIKTGSMETVNEKNKYIKENNLNNQITQFSLIGLKKIKEEDIKVYDVVGFKNDEGDIIVHRIIRINYNSEENKNYYTFQGDANSSSNKYELAVSYDKFVGKYTGFNNYGLGVLITYLKSSAGIVALSSCIFFLVTFNYSEDAIDKEYKKRFKYVADVYDNNKKLGVN